MKFASGLLLSTLTTGMLTAGMLYGGAYFEPNRGQSRTDAPFLARTPSGLAAIESARVRLRSTAGMGVEVRLEGAETRAQGVGMEPAPGVSHYALGANPASWIYGVPHYDAIQFRGVYPGVDLRYHFSGGNIEFDFETGSDAGASRIRLRFNEDVEVSSVGDLILKSGTVRRPSAWQVISGERRPVEASYRVIGRRRATFVLGPHDKSVPVTIDPIIDFATYLGGSSSEVDTQMVVDSSGNIYMAGTTLSADFPASELPGSPLNAPVFLREPDIYVTRLKPDGSAIDWSFFIGGTALERCGGLQQDSLGDIYVFGSTTSANFPVTQGAWHPAIDPSLTDEFVVKLDAQTGLIRASTYLGFTLNTGSQNLLPSGGFSVDYAGGVYASGTPGSAFQASAGAYLAKPGGAGKGIVRLNASLSSAVYATYMDIGTTPLLQADANGNLIFAGATGFSSPSFPAVNPIAGISQTGGTYVSFIAKLNASGSAFVYASELSGTYTSVTDLQVDASGNAWVAGSALNTGLPLVNPLTLDPVPPTFNATGPFWPFFAEIPPQGGVFLRSTLFYGPGYLSSQIGQTPPWIRLIFPAGRLCIAGTGVSVQTAGALGADGSNPQNMSLDCVDATGTRLGLQTFLPPSNGSYTAAQSTPDGAVLFAGTTSGDLVTTAGVVQPTFGGYFGNYDDLLVGGDAFLMRISLSNPAPQITSVFPDSLFITGASTGSFNLAGTGFGDGTQVTWNGGNIASTFNSSTQIQIPAVAAAVLQPGPNQIGASLAGPGGGASSPVTVTGYNPAPGSVSITPSSVPVGSAETKIVVAGNGVSSNSVLTWNGTVRVATYVANTSPQTGGHLEFLLEPPELSQSAVLIATVTNPAPGGGESLPARFVIQPASGAAPVLNSPGSFAFDESTPAPATIILSGSGFTAATAAYWDGAALPSTFVSVTQIRITPPPGAMSVLGTHAIYVSNGSLTSATVHFLVSRAIIPPNGSYNVLSAYDPARQIFYVLSQSATTQNSFDLSLYSSRTGGKTSTVPGVMVSVTSVAISDDGSYVYLGGGATGLEVKRFNTATAAVDLDWQITVPATSISVSIGSLATVTAAPQTVVILAGTQILIYDNDQLRPLTASISAGGCCGASPGVFATGSRIYLLPASYPCLQWWDFDIAGIEDGSGTCGLNPPELVTSHGFAWLTDGARNVTVNSPSGAGNATQYASVSWVIDSTRRLAYAISTSSTLQLLQMNLATLQQVTGNQYSASSYLGGIYLANDGSVRVTAGGYLLAP